MLFLLLAINISTRAESSNDSITIELKNLSKKSNLVGFGYADKELKIPYTVLLVQPIASISKTVIADALMKEQEMGKVLLCLQTLQILKTCNRIKRYIQDTFKVCKEKITVIYILK